MQIRFGQFKKIIAYCKLIKSREQTFLIYWKLFAFPFLYSFIYFFNVQAEFCLLPFRLCPVSPHFLFLPPFYALLLLFYSEKGRPPSHGYWHISDSCATWFSCETPNSRRCHWLFCYHLGPYSSYWLSSLITRLYVYSLTVPLHALYWFYFNIQGCLTYLELT